MSDSKKEIVITYLPSPLQHPFKCPVCEGTGSVIQPAVVPLAAAIVSRGSIVPTMQCPACDGTCIVWGPPAAVLQREELPEEEYDADGGEVRVEEYDADGLVFFSGDGRDNKPE